MEQFSVRVPSGTRIGFWQGGPHYVPLNEMHKHAFIPKGVYVGPDLGDPIIGTSFEQKLMEGTVKFCVGVLFRPDLGKHQKLETILILQSWVPEMFQYEHWQELTG